jgi:hypothetical protein
MDQLHRGLRHNPLYGGVQDGYKFSPKGDLVVASCGFADDFIIFSETPEGLDRLHHWVREFIGAHEMEINSRKTVYVTSDVEAVQIPVLTNVAGDELIEPQPDMQPFKYLGLWLRVARGQGAWDKQKAETEKAIRTMQNRIVSNRLDMIMSVHVINTILMPQVEMAGRMVNFTQADLERWNRTLIKSVLKAHGAIGGDTLSRVAFNQVTGLLHPRDVINTARVMDLAGRLTSPHRPDGQTLWARLRAAVGRRKSNDEILKVIGLSDVPCPRNNRIMKTFQFMKGLGMRAEYFPSPWWSNELQLVEEESWTGTAWEDEPYGIHIFRATVCSGAVKMEQWMLSLMVPLYLALWSKVVMVWRFAQQAVRITRKRSTLAVAKQVATTTSLSVWLCFVQRKMYLIKIRSPSTRTRQLRSGLSATSRNCHGRGV